MPSSPLIVTAALEPEAQRYFDRLRAEHFPAGRNFLDAHLTLFHALPESRQARVEQLLDTAGQQSPVRVDVTKLMLLGRGVAFRLVSDGLQDIRCQVARAMANELTRQDASKNELHITVQNKVQPDDARVLHQRLEDEFEPFSTTAVALDLWSYRQGPWEHRRRYVFCG